MTEISGEFNWNVNIELICDDIQQTKIVSPIESLYNVNLTLLDEPGFEHSEGHTAQEAFLTIPDKKPFAGNPVDQLTCSTCVLQIPLIKVVRNNLFPLQKQKLLFLTGSFF